jgi:hypothetical protein
MKRFYNVTFVIVGKEFMGDIRNLIELDKTQAESFRQDMTQESLHDLCRLSFYHSTKGEELIVKDISLDSRYWEECVSKLLI